MDFDYGVSQLSHNVERIRALAADISDEQARWKPDPETWSILEVINHLDEEERRDFRVRLDYILHRPGQPWPPIDPQGWVIAHQYNQRNLADSVRNFLTARQDSLAWLQELVDPDWTAAYDAPFGQITAGDMFAAWVAHDLLHMRQLVELHWAYTTTQLAPHQVIYAGEW